MRENRPSTMLRGASGPALAAAAVALLLLAPRPAVAVPIVYENPVDKYGQVENQVCPAAPNGICASVAMINSFVFLKNQYPDVFGDTQIERGPEANPNDAALAFSVNGWIGPNGQREGYNQRAGDAMETLWETKIDWLNDWAPDLTTYRGQVMTAPDGPDDGDEPDGTDPDSWDDGGFVENVWPQWDFVQEQIKNGEDVELVIRIHGLGLDEGFTGPGHVLTLYKTSFDDRDNDGDCGFFPQEVQGGAIIQVHECMISYIDPNDPTNPRTVGITLGEFFGDRIQFNDTLTFRKAVWVQAAFAESPVRQVDEPAGLALIVVGGLALALRRRKRR